MSKKETPLTSRQKTIAGLVYVVLIAVLVVIGFIDGEFLGETPRQKVFAIVIGTCVLIGVALLLFRPNDNTDGK